MLVAGFVVLVSTAFAQVDDPLKAAESKNETKVDEGVVNEEVAEFLVKSADARLMDAEEGRLALKNGTTDVINRYGKLMINDQSMLLKKLNKLAASKKITMPTGISAKKEGGREDLAKESGTDFDDKFIKMMIIDHEKGC